MQKIPGAASAALGRILSETRIARGLTLDDVERDTRIAKRYLEALEHEEFHVLPAPVYCRAFLRTYAQYLGLDPREIMRIYPEKGREPEIAPLPQVSKPAPPALSMNWIVAGGVVLLLLVAGFLLYGGPGDSDRGSVPAEEVAGSSVNRTEGAGAEAPDSEAIATAEGAPSAPTATGPAVPVPDVTGLGLREALPVLSQQGMRCVIMEVFTDRTDEEVVVAQSPAAGSEAPAGTTVTLTVSRARP